MQATEKDWGQGCKMPKGTILARYLPSFGFPRPVASLLQIRKKSCLFFSLKVFLRLIADFNNSFLRLKKVKNHPIRKFHLEYAQPGKVLYLTLISKTVPLNAKAIFSPFYHVDNICK